eukprot:Em0021g282a
MFQNVVNFIAGAAPFLAQYGHYIVIAVLTLLLAVIVAFFLSPETNNPKSATAATKPAPQDDASKVPPTLATDKGEHPLAEFENEKPDPELAPPLHAADTPQIPYDFARVSEKDMIARSETFYQQMNKRRSIRHFSTDPVPLEVINNIIKTAGTSPSGAHSEPWTFVVVRDPQLKAKVRDIVEQEEYTNYDRRMGDKWVNDLKFVRTTHEKPYLEDAPYIILVFKQAYHIGPDGHKYIHYYYEMSTAIACGILVAAIHNAGLVTVTTTPLNAGSALRSLLGRPDNEKAMLLLPVGYPSRDATVPAVSRKPLNDIMVLK